MATFWPVKPNLSPGALFEQQVSIYIHIRSESPERDRPDSRPPGNMLTVPSSFVGEFSRVWTICRPLCGVGIDRGNFGV